MGSGGCCIGDFCANCCIGNIPESVKLSKVQNGKQDLKTQRPKRCFC